MATINYIYEVILFEQYNSNVKEGGCQFVTYHPTEEKAVERYNKLQLKKPQNISSATKCINKIKCYEKIDCSKMGLHYATPEDKKCILSENIEVVMKEFNPYKCTSKDKDDLRPEHTGVYHTEGFKVATDTHILAVIKSKYPSELEGKIVDKNGAIINKRFPRYQSVIPQAIRSKEYSIDLVKFRETIEEAKIALKSNKLTYIAITDSHNIKVCHAVLFLSFLKTYKRAVIYTETPKDTNTLPTIFVRSGDSLLFCTHVASNPKHTIINNKLTTKI